MDLGMDQSGDYQMLRRISFGITKTFVIFAQRPNLTQLQSLYVRLCVLLGAKHQLYPLQKTPERHFNLNTAFQSDKI